MRVVLSVLVLSWFVSACGAPAGTSVASPDVIEAPTPDDAGEFEDQGEDLPDAIPDAVMDARPLSDIEGPEDVAPEVDVADSDPEEPCEAPRLHGVGDPLAVRNECGALSYGLYAAQGQAEALHTLPDFSFAGYMQGGVAIPDVPVVVTVEAGEGDDRQRIQDAIDEVSALPVGEDGARGAVLLERGRYEVGDTLRIEASGVVLRGEGQGAEGTVLIATRAAQHDLVRVQGGGQGLGEVEGSRVRIVSEVVPVGARTFEVESAAGFSVGAKVGVLRTPNQAWIDELGMGQWGWTRGSYTIGHERRIVGIEGNSISVDIPIVDAMEVGYGGGAVFLADLSERIEQVGVEDLRIVSEFEGATDERHGWVAVRVARATNTWVRRVTAMHFGYSAVSIGVQSSFNTVEECAMLAPVSQVTGGRRYAFNVDGGTGNLFQRCFSEEARHDFVSGARTTGPNVWLDCVSERSSNDDGPHHRWATGLLFDNALSRALHVENRQDSGTGHGWSGAQTLFWNGLARSIRCDAPRGAMNWAIGCVGSMDEGGWTREEPFGWWASPGRPVEPRSLYLQQLEDRLGPEAVANVTLPAQRAGRIWGLLAVWAGEGRLADVVAVGGDPECEAGIVSGGVCCEAACGECGGSGCGSRPGGASACCSGSISTSGRSCAVSGAPCVLDPVFVAIGE